MSYNYNTTTSPTYIPDYALPQASLWTEDKLNLLINFYKIDPMETIIVYGPTESYIEAYHCKPKKDINLELEKRAFEINYIPEKFKFIIDNQIVPYIRYKNLKYSVISNDDILYNLSDEFEGIVNIKVVSYDKQKLYDGTPGQCSTCLGKPLVEDSYLNINNFNNEFSISEIHSNFDIVTDSFILKPNRYSYSDLTNGNFIKYLNDTLSSSKILHAIYKVSYSVIGYKVKFKITCTDNGMSSSGEITRVVLEAKDKNEGKNACLGFFGYNTFEDVQKMGKGESSFYIESEKYIQLMVTTNVMFENFSVCTALHEFCHVLGFAHTHQVDNENPIKVEDWIVDELLKNFQNVEDVYQQIVLRDVNPIHQKFDTLSIMTYDIQSDWNRLGLSISSNFFLSESDKNSLKLMYPEVVEEKYIVYDPLIRSSTYYTPYTSTVSGITMIIIMILITIIYFRR